MDDADGSAARFEAHRPRLRAVAYRILGSHSDAEDAVQEAWLRVDRAGTEDVENLGAWLTTVVARVALTKLQARARTAGREQPLDSRVPDPVVTLPDEIDPADQLLAADAVGLALLVIIDSLAPPERLSFVLHDMFGLPFEDVAAVVGRTPVAARQLASRARRRVRAAAVPDPDPDRQRRVVTAFLAAARHGDFRTLLTLLATDAVLRADAGTPEASRVVVGAADVARQALSFAGRSGLTTPVLVNGAAGLLVGTRHQPLAVLGFTVADDVVNEMDILADPERIRRLDLPFPDEVPGSYGAGHTNVVT